MENLLSRKFILSVLALVMVFTLVMASKIDATEFMTLLAAILGNYTLGNVVSKFAPKP